VGAAEGIRARRKAVDLPERITPQCIGHLGGVGQVSKPPNSIGTVVQPQVVTNLTLLDSRPIVIARSVFCDEAISNVACI